MREAYRRVSEPGLALPLEASGVVVETQGARLLDAVDLELRAGPRTVLLGANGAGKSLLLHVLHGLTRPSAGVVRSGGRPLDAGAIARQGLVFQRPVLLRRSVAANLRFALRSRGVRGTALRERCALWLERAGLETLATRPARVLSGGEQQRLALARVLSLEPEILLLDEPTASLDPASSVSIETMIGEAHNAGTKVLLVTHDLGQARRMADEVVFLHRGRVEARGSAIEFFEDPGSEPARRFLRGEIVL